MGKYEAHTL
jgi:hypothetical protein